MERRTIRKESELGGFAKELLFGLKGMSTASVLSLQGDLGAGKTTLTKAFAKELGVKEDVTSPTFVIMRSYPIVGHPIFSTLTHIDAYRIDDIEEIRVLGFEELLNDAKRLIIIEWPERIRDLIPNDAHTITITITDGVSRELTY